MVYMAWCKTFTTFTDLYSSNFFVVSCGPSVWCGMEYYGMAGLVGYGLAWYGMVWYGMVWYDMVWYGMVWFVCFRIKPFLLPVGIQHTPCQCLFFILREIQALRLKNYDTGILA